MQMSVSKQNDRSRFISLTDNKTKYNDALKKINSCHW